MNSTQCMRFARNKNDQAGNFEENTIKNKKIVKNKSTVGRYILTMLRNAFYHKRILSNVIKLQNFLKMF